MARARNIKPGFFINPELAECSPHARLLFIGLWVIADREGRLEDRPAHIKVAIFPSEVVDVDKLLNELHSGGFAIRYEVLGKRYVWLPTFTRHQNPHKNEVPSILPEYVAEIRHIAPRIEDSGNNQSAPAFPSPLPLPSPSPEASAQDKFQSEEGLRRYGVHKQPKPKKDMASIHRDVGEAKTPQEAFAAMKGKR